MSVGQNTDIGISVIVCCYNSAHLLPKTIEHIAKQQVADLVWEIIVVDNASTDNTQEVAKQLLEQLCEGIHNTIVFEKKPGLSNARACGMENAKYNLLLFVDDDNRLSVDYVRKAYDIMEINDNISLLGGCGEPEYEGTPPKWFSEYHSSFALGSQAVTEKEEFQQVDRVYGAGIVIRKSIYEKLRHLEFPELLTGRKGGETISGEDNELCLALQIMGCETWYHPDLRFGHYMTKGRLNWNYLKGLFYGFGRAKAYLDIYRYFLKSDELPRSKSQNPFWKDRLNYLKKEYLKRKATFALKNIGQTKEGNNEYLLIEGMKGQIFELEKQAADIMQQYEFVLRFKTNAMREKTK